MTSPIHFTGKERDAETGLDYFGARYLSSAQGRWTSPDWSAVPQAVPYGTLGDPQTLNLYAYVRNNPLGSADADGHTDWYSPSGKKLGSDGVQNGAVAIGQSSDVSYGEDGTVLSFASHEMYWIDSSTGNAIRDSVDRSNAPAATPAGPDTTGGFHEEGFTMDSGGRHDAAPGNVARPTDSEASVHQKVSPDTLVVEHVHPVGTTDSHTLGGTKFQEGPSKKDLKEVDKAPNAIHIEANASGTVYFYNANGAKAHVPLDAFPKPEKKQ